MPGPQLDFDSSFADVKTPGDGRAYTVGTVEVNEAQNIGSLFSFELVLPPQFIGFPPLPGGKRQVAVLQVTDAATQRILWQRFFFGTSPPPPVPSLLPTNARGVAVWTHADEMQRRVVICGETFDERLEAVS